VTNGSFAVNINLQLKRGEQSIFSSSELKVSTYCVEGVMFHAFQFA